MKHIIIIGAGGHAQIVADIFLQNKISEQVLKIDGFVDDNPALHHTCIGDLPVFGSILDLRNIQFDYIIIGIGNNNIRHKLYKKLAHDSYRFANAIHDKATIAMDVCIGDGVVACANAVVNIGSQIKSNVILNTSCSVDHHNYIDNHVHIGPGATLGGDVIVEEGAMIGIGATILPQHTIGRWTIVGAGAVVTKDVPERAIVAGVPARLIGWNHG